jgi:hypothetical protein
MAVRKHEAVAAPATTIEQRLAALEAENALLARAFCRLAVKMPGGNPELTQILTLEVGLSRDDAEKIITAAQRTG